MTEPHDAESTLHDRMQDATRDVVASAELTRSLIVTASTSRPASRPGRLLKSGRFPSAWMLPAAAAVTMLLVAGSVVAAQQLSSHSSNTPGVGAFQPSTSAPVAEPTQSSVAPSPTATISPTPTSEPHSPTASRTEASRSTSPAAPSEPRTSTASGPSSTPTTVIAAGPPAGCSAPETGKYLATSLQDFVNHVIGTWLVCSEPSVFGTDDAGLQISADGHWAKLFRDAAGHLVAGVGSQQRGSWEAVDDSAMNGRPMFQINLQLGGGTVIAPTQLSTGVTRMHLDNNGFYEANYVPSSEPVR
jgi:hypothetical protein